MQLFKCKYKIKKSLKRYDTRLQQPIILRQQSHPTK